MRYSDITVKESSLQVIKTANINLLRLPKVSITQGSSLTTGVSVNSASGFITTFTSGVIATSGSSSFPVTNSSVQANTHVLASINNYSGTGIPIATVTGVTLGSFVVKINNLDDTNATNNAIKIGFSLL